MVSSIPSTYFVFISLDVFLVSFIKNLITSNAFYVILTPSTHGDFIACVLIKVVWGLDKIPIYLCCWHVFKAWRLCGTEKIKDVEV
jgi:hypothetical protein